MNFHNKKMKRITFLFTILFYSLCLFSQNPDDSHTSFIKSLRLSVEAGYNFLIPSATERDSYYRPSSTEVTNPFSFHYGEDVLKLLGCTPVAAEDILLKPSLLK